MPRKTQSPLILSALSLFVFIFAATFSAAQEKAPHSQDERKLILPLEVVAGEPATLAVLGPDGRILPGAKVVLSSGQVVTTDASGRGHFLQPPGAGVTFARIEGSSVREATDALPRDDANTELQVTRMPRFVPVENHFIICGMGFQGDADQNRVELSNKPVLILASSPLQLIVMPPAKSRLGAANLLVVEGTAEVAARVTLIDVTAADSGGNSIHPRKKSSILVRAVGTTEPVDLLIRNLSRNVVEFPHADEQHVQTTGGPDNAALVQLKSVGMGPFSYAVKLDDTSRGVNASVARDFLEAALKTVPPDIASRVAVTLREIHEDNTDTIKARNELNGISNQAGSEDFQALIRAAQRALAGE